MRLFFVIAILFTSLIGHTQNVTTTWADEFKLGKGSFSYDIIHADANHVYLIENHEVIAFGKGYRTRATLVVLGRDLQEVYRKDYDKLFKGKSFEDIRFVNGKMIMLASNDPFVDELEFFGIELNKQDGEPVGDWVSLHSWPVVNSGRNLWGSKLAQVVVRPISNVDSTSIILMGATKEKEYIKVSFVEINDKLAVVNKPVTIQEEFDPTTFTLEDILVTKAGTVAVVGRKSYFREGKKEKDKNLDYTEQSVSLYNTQGKLLKRIDATQEGNWLKSSAMHEINNNQLLLTAFYGKEKNGDVTGILVQKIDPLTGEVIQKVSKELKPSLFTQAESVSDDEDDDDKKSKKENNDGGEAIAATSRFLKPVATNDGVIIMGENINNYSRTYNDGNNRTRTVYYNECKDVLMMKLTNEGEIAWLNILPKYQLAPGGGNDENFFNRYSVGLYSSIGVFPMPEKGKTFLLLNDSEANGNVTEAGQKIKRIVKFNKSNCYLLTLDNASGALTRKVLFSNSDQPMAAVKDGFIVGNKYYVKGVDEARFKKTSVTIGIIQFK